MAKTPYTNLLRSIMQKERWQAENSMKDLGVTTQQARAIGYIAAHQDKGLIQKDLAEAFQRRGASITSLMQGLERRGFIERRVPNNNERQKNIYVLPKGQEIVEAIDATFQKSEDDLISSLSKEEQEILLTLLKKIDASL